MQSSSSNPNRSSKRDYVTPTVSMLGSFNSLTMAMQMGPYADMARDLMMMN